MEVRFYLLTEKDPLWQETKDYARRCPWPSGARLADSMDQGKFTDWQRVVVTMCGETICGFCAIAAKDCIPDVEYTPYIGAIYVDEAYRGHRISEQMIRFSMDHLRAVGFDRVYVISGHVGLYEKYGFSPIDHRMASWGEMQTIFVSSIPHH